MFSIVDRECAIVRGVGRSIYMRRGSERRLRLIELGTCLGGLESVVYMSKYHCITCIIFGGQE